MLWQFEGLWRLSGPPERVQQLTVRRMIRRQVSNSVLQAAADGDAGSFHLSSDENPSTVRPCRTDV